MATSLAISSSVFLRDVALSSGQIVAIDAQDAFVLRQGPRHEHVGSVVLFCAMTDVLLILVGVLGMAQVLGERPSLARFFVLAGAALLLLYGAQAFRRARYSNQLRAAAGGDGLSRRVTLAQAAAFTLLSPHVYLDTVLLVGNIGVQQVSALRGWFVAGARLASSFWFVLLGFDARRLAPWLARPKAWQILDRLIGVTTLVLSILLLRHVLCGFRSDPASRYAITASTLLRAWRTLTGFNSAYPCSVTRGALTPGLRRSSTTS